jgi:uncharacterized protein (TIGR03066 family)
LQQVVKLVPDDKVAAELLKMASSDGQPGTEQAPVAGGAEQPASTGAEVDPASLVGTWKAAPQGGPTFELSLTPDSKFTWKFTQKGKATEFGGTYSVEGDVLTLARGAAGAVAGNAAFDGAGTFTFKPVGAPATEPGLSFRRS